MSMSEDKPEKNSGMLSDFLKKEVTPSKKSQKTSYPPEYYLIMQEIEEIERRIINLKNVVVNTFKKQ